MSTASSTEPPEIMHVEVTQGLQNHANDLPLVLGKPTWVRVYPRISGGGTLKVMAEYQLTAFNASGDELASHPAIWTDRVDVVSQPLGNMRLDKEKSVNFRIPIDLIPPERDELVRLRIRVRLAVSKGAAGPDPSASVRESEYVFYPRTTVTIRYLPVEFIPPEGPPQRPRHRVSMQVACDYLRALLPIAPSRVIYVPWPGVPLLKFSKVTKDNKLDGDQLRLTLRAMMEANRSFTGYLYAWTPDGSFQFNGMADVGWSRSAFGNDTGGPNPTSHDSRWRRTMAHEIGHLLQLPHADDQCRIRGSLFGYDVLDVDPVNVVKRSCGTAPDECLFDVMVPARVEPDAWIHDENVQKLFGELRPAAPARVVPTSGPAHASGGNARVIRGYVTRDTNGGGNIGGFYPSYLVPIDAEIAQLMNSLPNAGTHSIRRYTGGNNTGEVLVRWTPEFDAVFVDSNEKPGTTSFMWYVPEVPGVTKLVLTRMGASPKEFLVPEGMPTIDDLRADGTNGNANYEGPLVRQGAQVHVKWQASGNGDLSYALEYSPTGDEPFLPITMDSTENSQVVYIDELPRSDLGRGTFRLRVTNGYNQVHKTIASPIESAALPVAYIAMPAGDTVLDKSGTITLAGFAHMVDGTRVAASDLQWSIRRPNAPDQVPLGTGEMLDVPVDLGSNEIELVARVGHARSRPVRVAVTVQVN